MLEIPTDLKKSILWYKIYSLLNYKNLLLLCVFFFHFTQLDVFKNHSVAFKQFT